MDNYDLLNFNEQRDGPGAETPEQKPLNIDLGDEGGDDQGSVSRQPLNLGGSGGGSAGASVPASATPAGSSTPTPAPSNPDPPTAPVPTAAPAPVASAAVAAAAGSPVRFTGVKTFFTKLHQGAIVFLDEQITNWFRDNPQFEVKHTSVCVGDVVAKKTEPNLIVMIWY